MKSAVKQRVRLWLRSERASGLAALPVKVAKKPARRTTATAQANAAASSPAARAATPPPPRSVPAVRPAAAPTAVASKPAAAAITPPVADQTPFTSPVLSRDEKIAALQRLNEKHVRDCRRCRLCEQRTNTVFGEGDVDAPLMFIGEGPGETEDQTGRPFVGRAGETLEKMIVAMGLARERVYIANVVKCRPPGNRTPVPDEINTCAPLLLRQIEIVRPRVIVTLGLPATHFILQTKLSMGRLRGNWHEWRGIKVMPTYHPAYLLRNYNVETRKAVWSDLQQVMAELGLQRKQHGPQDSG